LILDNQEVSFNTKLKLTGNNVKDCIVLPDASLEEIENFLKLNNQVFNNTQKQIIRKLVLEAANNDKLKIEVSGNS